MFAINRNNNNFDFLRVFAALCITFTHSFNLLKLDNDEPLMLFSNHVIDFSFVGLSIFFSISGYLIAKSAIESTSFKNYIWKRFLRIQPLLIVVCLLSIFIIGPLFTSLNGHDYFSNRNTYTYLRNIMPLFGIQFTLPNVFTNNIGENGINGSMWTLIVEERLYLIVGLLFLGKKLGSKLFFVLVGAFNLIYFLHSSIFNNTWINYLNGGQVFYALIFLNASCLFLLKIDFKKYANSWQSFLFIALSVVLLCVLHSISILQVLIIPILVILLANIKAATNNAGKYGDFTYGIYIFSFPVQQVIIASSFCKANPISLFFSTLLIVLPCAFLSWHLLEKKMITLKSFVK
jgi:peptidoglycan/LPS O-acetylase OafA/YrhL